VKQISQYLEVHVDLSLIKEMQCERDKTNTRTDTLHCPTLECVVTDCSVYAYLKAVGGTLKTRDWKRQDWKTREQITGRNRRTGKQGTKFPGVEKSGLENAGTSCAWVAKCNIINVRGHVRANVTAGRGDPRTLQEATQSGN